MVIVEEQSMVQVNLYCKQHIKVYQSYQMSNTADLTVAGMNHQWLLKLMSQSMIRNRVLTNYKGKPET